MFFATLPEKLGLISLLIKASEKIRLGQNRFDMEDVEELVRPYDFLRYYDRAEEPVPSSFLSVFNTLIDPEYLASFGKKLEGESREISYGIGDIEISKIKIDPSKEIVNILNAHFLLKNVLDYVMSDFKIGDNLCNYIIRAIEAFSHYSVVYNLGLPISKLEIARPVECNTKRIMLYNFLESSRDIPKFIAVIQTQWEEGSLKKNKYLLLRDNKDKVNVFIVNVNTLADEELARILIGKFRDPQQFEENGIWFPERISYCGTCRKAISGFEKNCKGIEVSKPHPSGGMNELCGIVLHEELSEALPYLSEYLVIHTLRRLLSIDKLFGFLAHSVSFADEEIDIIALILFKNYVKIFPIEVQTSSSIKNNDTEEKFKKLKELIESNKRLEKYKLRIHNLFITFEEYEGKNGNNFSIYHFSKLDEIVKNLLYSNEK